MKGIEAAGVARAKDDPDRAAVADHEGRQLPGGEDIVEGREHSLLLLDKRLPVRKTEAGASTAPGREKLGLVPFDVDEQVPFPSATVGFPQTGVEAGLEPDARADDGRRLASAREIGGPHRPEAVAGNPCRELARLLAANVVKGRVAKALDADGRKIVVGLAVAGQDHPGIISHGEAEDPRLRRCPRAVRA